MKRKQQQVTRSTPRTRRGFFGDDGTAVTEFALAAPILVVVVLGIADLGRLAANTAALEGATRVGAEYARNSSTCQNSYQSSSCMTGIENAMQNSGNFSPSLTYPSSSPVFPTSCQCDDGSLITCGTTCAVGNTPNRVLITVTATQAYTPILPWPGIPTSLSASTEMRVE